MKHSKIFAFSTIGIIAVLFFFGNHYIYMSTLDYFDLSQQVFEEAAQKGNMKRKIAFLLLCFYGAISLLGKGRYKYQINGMPGYLIICFIAWALASVYWSIDVNLTIRRLGVFLIFCITAMAIIKRLPVEFLPLCAFVVTFLYLCTGLTAEIMLGTFRPLSYDYRFAGSLHSNQQGLNCAIMFISSIALYYSGKRFRSAFLAFAAVALTALVLTKTRTAFASAMLALCVLLLMTFGKMQVFALVAGIISIFSLFYMAFYETLFEHLFQYLNLGRDPFDIATFTGRTQIWESAIWYIKKNPIIGHGFNSFWVPERIGEFSKIVGIGIIGAHNDYIDLLLNLGAVGLVLYLCILAGGVKNAHQLFSQTCNEGYIFIVMIMIFSLTYCLLESSMLQMSSVISFFFVCSFAYVSFQGPILQEMNLPIRTLYKKK